MEVDLSLIGSRVQMFIDFTGLSIMKDTPNKPFQALPIMPYEDI